MKKIPILFSIAMASIITSCSNNDSPKGNDTSSNPLMAASTLPYQAPEFNKIKDGDYQPAIEEGMKQQMAEMDSIANNTAEPTFENTMVAMEKSGQLLHRAYAAFNVVSGANTNETLQKVQEAIAPKLAAHQDAIYLNAKLFNRVQAIYDKRSGLNLDAESLRLVEYYYQQFVKAGAKLTDENKTALKKLNEEEAGLGAKFTNMLLAAAKNGALVLDNKEALAGMSDGDIEAAAKDAKDAGKAGKWLLSLQNTTQQPALGSLSNRNTRRQLFDASWNRAERGDANDTRATISRIAKIRAEKAKLLGLPNYASWQLQDQMAETPAAVMNFFNQLIPAATAKARKEAADIQDLIHQQKDTFNVEAYDWDYYADQVRKARYDLDESQIKPYFVLDSVLKNGVFYAATQLYGITFKERKDIPVYQKDVRVFELFNEDGSAIGLFYCDYFKRDNKNGGAWMENMVGQSKLLGTKPVIYNVCNFTKPADGQPALISFDDVTTMFHEFGHALHGFFADQQYPSLSGTATARDFVEFPSQFNEHWALYPTILKNYAKHYKTNETIPDALVAKIKNAGTFNQGYALTEILAAAGLDMQWHSIGADAPEQNVDTFETAALKKIHLDLSYVPSRYRSSYFLHIWSNGYSAGYYAYLWTEMLDDDAYSWFEENGGLTRTNGQRFRDMVLSRGNTIELGKMFQDFRGHTPDIKPMLKNRGLVN
ncbi:peptidyl-dipeptidase Dcp [Taibaiella lutea]|uniref:Dipeptidyl carboxypeptidase n=1 Tax=Taibaiella lutea TaxID=2608001 RepID=A0A5M6CNT2_9BACT|nr:peptidyl-dipeptidase Dcp [Taibaiella lutea]KAA5536794.1 peptidyl-dipeptidase Dcp [Taibaiella lutea]